VIAEGVETLEHGFMLLMMGCDKAQGYFISRPMPADQFPTWLSNYTVNQEWKRVGNKAFTARETKIQLLRLSIKRWQKHLEENILSSPEDISHWPILKKTKCHCGVLIKRAREEALFEEIWLNKLDDAHDSIHNIADDLFNKYQKGEISKAREGLNDLHKAIERMFGYFEAIANEQVL